MTDPSANLANVAARYWDLVLAFSPIYATYLGDRRFDDRLDDGSDDAIADQRARLESIRGEVEAIPARDLQGEDRITRSALLAQISRSVARLDANLEAWTVDPLDGPQVAALNLPPSKTSGPRLRKRKFSDCAMRSIMPSFTGWMFAPVALGSMWPENTDTR